MMSRDIHLGGIERWRYPLLIFACALIIRAILAIPAFTQQEIAYTADSPRYERLAVTMIQEGVYEAHELIDYPYPDLDRKLYTGPEYFRVPGYPLFLAAIFLVFGYSTTVALAVQVVISATACVLLYELGRAHISNTFGIICAFIFALNLKVGLHAGQITSETLFTFLLILCAYSGIRLWQQRTMRAASWCVLAFAAMAMTRPVGLHLAIIFTGVSTVVFLRDRRLLLMGVAPLLGVIVVLNAWSYRNYEISGVWSPTSNPDVTLGLYMPSLIWAHARDESQRDGQIEMLRRNAVLNPKYLHIYEGAVQDSSVLHVWQAGYVHDIEFAAAIRPVGIQLMLEEWPTTVKTMVTGSIWSIFSGMGEWRNRILSGEEYDRMKRYVPEIKKRLSRLEAKATFKSVGGLFKEVPTIALILFVLMGIYHLLLLVFSVAGIKKMLARPSAPGWLMLMWIGYIMAAAGLAGNSRYAAPALPFMSVAATFGLLQLYEIYQRRRLRHVT